MPRRAFVVTSVVVALGVVPVAAAGPENAKSAAEYGASGSKSDAGHPVSLRAAVAEGFEGGSMPPAGWLHIQTNPNATWAISPSLPHSGTYAADILPNLSQQTEIIYSPAVTAGTAFTARFWSYGSIYWCRDTYDSCDLDVYLDLDTIWNNGNETLVYTADVDWRVNYTWAQSTVNLDAFADGTTRYVAFVYDGENGGQVKLDDIELLTDADAPVAGCAVGYTRAFEEHYETWPLPGWTIINNGGDCVWDNNVNYSNPNYTSGSGLAADADSDECGSGTSMDTELVSPSFDLTGAVSAQLSAKLYYDDYSVTDLDHFDVEVSSDGGGSWATLQTFAGSDFPGQDVTYDISAYASATTMVRFVYVGAFAYGAQVDDVYICADLGAAAETDLQITKTSDAAGSVAPGDPVTYGLSVTNNGPGDATGVVVSDPLPAQMTYSSNTCSAAYDGGSHTITWTVGNLANGATANCSVVTQVAADADGLINNTATVAGNETDPTAANDASAASITVAQQVPAVPALGLGGILTMLLALAGAALFLIHWK